MLNKNIKLAKQMLVPILALFAMVFSGSAFTNSIIWEAAANTIDKSQLIEGEVILAQNASSTPSIIISNGGASGTSSYTFTGIDYTDLNFTPTPGVRVTADVSEGAASTGDTNFDDLIKSMADSQVGITSGTQVLTALVDGASYKIQVFYNDQRSTPRTMTYSDNESSANTVDISSAGSGWGQFATGTFTASGTSQSLGHITNGFGNVHINALILTKTSSPLPPVNPHNYYVSPTGDDSNAGTFDNPFATVQKAVDVMTEGDTTYIRGGTYFETVTIDNLQASENYPAIFRNYQDEVVTFTGAQSITDLGSTGWTQHSGNIYKTVLNTDIWQLWVDSEMMIPARWPNANFDDGSIWNEEKRAHGDNTVTSGVLKDDPHSGIDLAASGIDMTGAMAVMNIGSWKAWTREIISHGAGQSSFSFDPVPLHLAKHQTYFIDSKLALLDAAKEWFFDKTTKTLYLWAPDGNVPSGNIQAKTKDYAFDVSNSHSVQLIGLDFFGVAVNFTDSPYTLISDSDFLYPSAAKRMLGSNAAPLRNSIKQASKSTPSYSKVYNTTFKFAEGEAIIMSGLGDVIENSLFEYNDWSASELNALMATVEMGGDNNVFRRNTMRVSGASQAISIRGTGFLGELNDISEFGLLSSDGAAFQMTIPTQPGSELRYNWMYNSDEHGVRFDAPVPATNWGADALAHHNVGWGGLTDLAMVKGVDHQFYNSTGFGSSNNDIVIANDVLEWSGTITRNNIGAISGTRSGYVAPPGQHSNNINSNVTGVNPDDELIDVSQRDFRPKATSPAVDGGMQVAGITGGFVGIAPDIGAYESGELNYWIPGRQLTTASQPIPTDGATLQMRDRQLIWLGGLNGTSYDIYFGDDFNTVQTATATSDVYQGRQTNNIYTPDYGTTGGDRYWRIDTVTSSGTVTGNVWSLSVLAPATGGTTLTINPEHDAWVFEGNTANYGATATLRTRGYQTAGSRLSYLKFNLGDQSQSTITKVTLRVKTKNTPISDLTVWKVADTSWDEATITGSNNPQVGDAITTVNNLQAETWYDIDLSSYIKGGGRWSIALTTTQNSSALDYSSKEGTDPAELIVELE
ncbi:hypothetical protein RI845_17000 [Thalassotalea nanhaiensis]|uniref:DNRLRE domain-containing protein n=1 Tax=Thalassotalea nanhaiensis TaxID=3065648 RepID=A0ABY9TII9_9GAMM|nr:hypothetical protein RI845_17000 [Colwelliaceae bacterium SQ345]